MVKRWIKEINDDYAYVLGLIAGDGGINKKDQIFFCVGRKEIEFKDSVNDVMKRFFLKDWEFKE